MVKKTSKKKYMFPITLFFIFAGSAMIAHGLRMMTQGLFFPTSYYPAPLPSTIDFWFDWFLLFILGTIVIYLTMKQWFTWIHKTQSRETNIQ